jgi:hypothetical protein
MTSKEPFSALKQAVPTNWIELVNNVKSDIEKGNTQNAVDKIQNMIGLLEKLPQNNITTGAINALTKASDLLKNKGPIAEVLKNLTTAADFFKKLKGEE